MLRCRLLPRTVALLGLLRRGAVQRAGGLVLAASYLLFLASLPS